MVGECEVGSCELWIGSEPLCVSSACLWAEKTPLGQLKWNWHRGVKESDEVHHKLLSHEGVKVMEGFDFTGIELVGRGPNVGHRYVAKADKPTGKCNLFIIIRRANNSFTNFITTFPHP